MHSPREVLERWHNLQGTRWRCAGCWDQHHSQDAAPLLLAPGSRVMGAGITKGSLCTALARFVLTHPQTDTETILPHHPHTYNPKFHSFSWCAALVKINKDILLPPLLLHWTVSYSSSLLNTWSTYEIQCEPTALNIGLIQWLLWSFSVSQGLSQIMFSITGK